MPEYTRPTRETIAQLRALADELEAELPKEPPDEIATARERGRRKGITLIQGTGIAVAAMAAGRWIHQHTLPAALLLTGGAVAGGIALAPAVAPVVPGLPVIEGDNGAAPQPTVTRTVPAPAPTTTVTPPPATPTPSPSVPPTIPPSFETPSPAPSGTQPGTPQPTPGPTGGGGDALPPADGPPDEPPPPADAEPAACVLGIDLPAAARIRLLCG